jgi:adenylosuccinate lyase
LAEPIENLAAAISSLSRMASNLRWWQASEVGETAAPYLPSEYSSTTMPIKRNPEALEHIVGAAALVRGYAAAMQSISMLDNRDGTRTPVELTALPQSYCLAHRSLRTMVSTIEGLEVNAAAMKRNIDHPNVLGAAAGERLMVALYRKTGRRDWAHTVLHDCATLAAAEGKSLGEAVLRHAELGSLFEPTELKALVDLTTYTGSAAVETLGTVGDLRRSRAPKTANQRCDGRPVT